MCCLETKRSLESLVMELTGMKRRSTQFCKLNRVAIRGLKNHHLGWANECMSDNSSAPKSGWTHHPSCLTHTTSLTSHSYSQCSFNIQF